MKITKDELEVLIDALEGNISCIDYNLKRTIKTKDIAQKIKKLEVSKKLLKKVKNYEPDES